MNKFSIIIPNWNGQKFLQVCLDSIREQSYKNFEIIIIDNGSIDDSIAFLEKNYPEVRLIKLPRNIGFSPAVNLGIVAAKNELIFLLNNDTELDREFLAEMSRAVDKYQDAGMYASKMLSFTDRSIIDTCGDRMTWSGRSYKFGEGEKDGENYSKSYYTFGACGGAVVYRKSMLGQIGLFDEDFFAYLEDVDIDFRAQLAGFKCVFVPDAKVFHIGSATSNRISGFAFRLMIKNHYHLIFKNYPTSKIITNLHKILYSDLRFFAAAIRYHMVGAYLTGAYQAISEFPKMIAKRREIQKSKKVSNKYLDSIIEKDFNYKSILEVFHDRK
ncbi:MAG: glycosyltransferase family 2 protein [bacterium]